MTDIVLSVLFIGLTVGMVVAFLVIVIQNLYKAIKFTDWRHVMLRARMLWEDPWSECRVLATAVTRTPPASSCRIWHCVL